MATPEQVTALLERLQQENVSLPLGVRAQDLQVFSAEHLARIWRIRKGRVVVVPWRVELVTRIMRFYYDSDNYGILSTDDTRMTMKYAAHWEKLEYLTPFRWDFIAQTVALDDELQSVLKKERFDAVATVLNSRYPPQQVFFPERNNQ